jgi:hypothetical protein
MQFEGQESEARTQLVDLFSILPEGSESMYERLINGLLTQRLLVCFAWLVPMGSGLYAFRYVACRSTRPLGSA